MPKDTVIEDAKRLAQRDKFRATMKTFEQTTHDRARDELKALERHLVKRCLMDEFSMTNLWLLVDAKGRGDYVARVTDCEGCLTQDACAIRGQCAHYLRERGDA